MITKREYIKAREEAAELIKAAGVALSDQEIEQMDVADFGLGNLMAEGAQIVPLIDTDKIAMRVIALFPGQTEPEHWHTGFDGYEGKQETLRIISGRLYLYLPGEDTVSSGCIPAGRERYYTSRKEHILESTDTITMPPLQKHWFQAGPEGCVFYTVSTLAVDAKDLFSDPNIVRKTKIKDSADMD